MINREKNSKRYVCGFPYSGASPKGKVPSIRFTISNGQFEEVADSEDLNLYSWIDAFAIYMSVQLEFFSAEAQDLFFI